MTDHTPDQRYNARKLNASAEHSFVHLEDIEYLNWRYGVARVSDALRYLRLIGPRSPFAYLVVLLRAT